MKILKHTWQKVLVIILLIVMGLAGAGYLYFQQKIAEVLGILSGCNLENRNFSSTVDFEYVSHWIVIKAKINGSDKEYDFIFDTGAQTVFSDSLFQELGIGSYKKVNIQTDTEAHAFRNEIVSIDKLEMGDVIFRDVGAMIVENSEYQMLNCISPYGIIGYNVLQTCCFQIDYQQRQIKMTDQIDRLENVEEIPWITYTTLSQETPIIPAVINDRFNVKLFFDTGYSGAVALSSERLYHTIRESFPEQTALYTTKPTINITDGKEAHSFQKLLFKTSTFSIGFNITENEVISVKDVKEGKFTGFIGNQFFENYVITLDYINKRVGLLPYKKTDRHDQRTTFGLSYTPLDNKLYVTAVYKRSEAEKRGICVGDEIISINGNQISELPGDAFCKIYRGEYDFIHQADSLLILEVERNGGIVICELEKFPLFLNSKN